MIAQMGVQIILALVRVLKLVDSANLSFADIYREGSSPSSDKIYRNLYLLKQTKKIMKNNVTATIPVRLYYNSHIQKRQICLENINKCGIYRWTNIVSNKSYVGSCLNLFNRFKNYFSVPFIEYQITKSKSIIYRALLKYGYSSFKLDILEYCDPSIIIAREQHYLDKLNPEYNILKFARSLIGFKHSIISIKKISKAKLGLPRNEVTKLKLSSNIQAHALKVTNTNTKEVKLFASIRKAAQFISIHHSYLAKCLRNKNVYIGRGFSVVKKT